MKNSTEQCYRPSRHVTRHARRRMAERGISRDAISATLTYGHVAYRPGVRIFSVGRQDIAEWARTGVDLGAYEGVHVVCSLKDTNIMTVYRRAGSR